MTRAMNLEAIEKVTGKSWAEWLKLLERVHARELSHAEIAQKVLAHEGVTNWWSQMIAVAYEQQIGRRRPGQTSHGTYQVAVSRTVDGTLDEALRKWLAVVAGRQKFSGVSTKGAPTVSRSGTFRYWRCGLDDGSGVRVGVSQKKPGKAVIALAHRNLTSLERGERWRAFWKAQLMLAAGRPKRTI